MSQQKTLDNLEKAKRLRAIRKSLGLTQVQMAEKLWLHPTYLSQLETGDRSVDDSHIARANKVAEDLANANLVKEGEQPYEGGDLIRRDCHKYIDLVLDSCRGDERRTSWVYIELKHTFPLPNSTVASAATDLLDEAASGVAHPDQSLQRSPEAGGPIVQSDERVSYGAKRPTQKLSTPKKAPK